MKPTTAPRPPRHLKRSGRELFRDVQREYSIDDPAGLALLTTAAECLDRVREAQRAIAKHGAIDLDRYGGARMSPACVLERDARAQFLASLKQLNLDLEPLRDRPFRLSERESVGPLRATEIDAETAHRLLTAELLLSERDCRLWREHGAALVADWIADYPGRRPCSWWRYSAPEPRRQLGGHGVLISEQWRNLRQTFSRGVPDYFEIGRSPPRYESESAYLDRLGLFVPGERSRVPASAFEPELVLDDDDAA